MFDVKNGIENFTGVKISTNKILDYLEKELKKDGLKYFKENWKALTKKIKHKHKRLEHRYNYMQVCLENGIEYNAEVEALSFELKFGKKEDKESETNVTFDVGVTSALVGYLLIQIPNPICNAFGQGLIWFGLGMAAPEITGKINESKRLQREEERNRSRI